MKTVTITVQMQLDIVDNGNDLSNIVETLSNMNDAFVNMFPESCPVIFTSSIDDSDILSDDEINVE
jgi:hypothetical protein